MVATKVTLGQSQEEFKEKQNSWNSKKLQSRLEECPNAVSTMIAQNRLSKTKNLERNSMTQKNISTNTVRRGRRQPCYVESSMDTVEHVTQSSLEAPAFWTSKDDFNQTPIHTPDTHGKLISDFLSNSLQTVDKVEVIRLENCEFWAHYCLKRTRMTRKCSNVKYLNDVILIHGTSLVAASKIPIRPYMHLKTNTIDRNTPIY